MNRSSLTSPLLAGLLGALLLAGCAVPNGGSYSVEAGPAAPAASAKPAISTTPATPPVATPAVPPPLTPEQQALRDGTELYNKGDYNAAIKRLSAPEITNGSKASQISALKYIAFSYCVTGRQTLCRQQFEKAFKLDPAFDLAQGEHGHPNWGKAFARAKKGGKP